MEPSATASPRVRAQWPRFSLRALLLAVVMVAVLVQLAQIGWNRYLRYREAREYATIQATQKWPIASRSSFVIDEGRGVPDDFVILVRRGDVFGCFIPHNQCKKGESVEYDWYYRTDGVAQFNPDDPSVQKGKGISGPQGASSGSLLIEFGPFQIPWSGRRRGWGFVYFDYNPPDRTAPDILRICATNMKSLSYLDGRDTRWLYKAYPGDIGISSDEPRGSK